MHTARMRVDLPPILGPIMRTVSNKINKEMIEVNLPVSNIARVGWEVDPREKSLGTIPEASESDEGLISDAVTVKLRREWWEDGDQIQGWHRPSVWITACPPSTTVGRDSDTFDDRFLFACMFVD